MCGRSAGHPHEDGPLTGRGPGVGRGRAAPGAVIPTSGSKSVAVCADHQRHSAVEGRCQCGSLLARVVRGHVEIKCRRCKRLAVIKCDGLRE